MSIQSQDQNAATVIDSCCGLSRRSRQVFWGTILVLIGGALLLSFQAPFHDAGKYILPVFLVVWGGWKLWNVLRTRA